MTIKITSSQQVLAEIEKQRGQNPTGMIFINVSPDYKPGDDLLNQIQSQPGINHVQYRPNLLYIEVTPTDTTIVTG
ncbi:MAG: hypothetical protein A3F54_04965 [Candidatus Kerfeldbacteria bacterium RIFCSPHIGHO2_12_FULL_48_17]|uniref:Uncharacterized protein n=1 Tax=Candidatus Kerfeldbacteria bacterium RIFCSPHIGHO2_12_FULL_48_17 TaxID=1798542 RepID=A0A1G2B4R6_9BACT|nr:MAG: hypothetical protein A3F54_04965 [Candidatus Kerfeldbacteria bacterium RIFCSPHIGHO2_12_FULL_48_17]